MHLPIRVPTAPIISIRGGGTDPRATQNSVDILVKATTTWTRRDVVNHDSEMDDNTGNEGRNQNNLLTLTNEDFNCMLDGDVGFLSQASTTRQGQNDSMMLDVHPDDLRRKLDAVVEEDDDKEMRERKYLEDLFGKLDETGDRNVDVNQSTLQEDDHKMPASQPSTRANMKGVARLPVQQERDHGDEGDDLSTSSVPGSYAIDEGLDGPRLRRVKIHGCGCVSDE